MKRRMNPHTGLAPLLLVTAVGLLVASCSQDDAQAGDAPSSGRVALSLPALYTADAPATRTTTTFPTDESKGIIGFFVKAGDANNGYLAINNRPGTFEDEGLTPRNLWVPTPDIWLNNHDADVAVYAPYDATQSTTGTLALTAAEYTDARDLSLHRMVVSSLTMKDMANPVLDHLYSRLTVTFVKDANYAAVAKITSLTASGPDIHTSATFDPFAAADNAYTRTGTGFTVIPATPPTLGTDATAADAAKIDLLIIPIQQTSLTPVTLTVVMEEGVKLEVELPTTTTHFQLAAGMRYDVKLTLISGRLDLNGIHTMNWDSQTPADGGGLRPVLTLEPTEPGPVMIGGLEWSAYNCDGTGGFVTKPWEYGAYFTFEAGDGTGGNRCPAGYRQPTGDELRKLVDNKAPAGKAIKINGKKYTTNSAGFIGEDADPNSGLVVKEGANILFLPAAGIRTSNNVMQDAGMWGYYWGNALIDDIHGISTCFSIDFAGLDGYEHTTGLPVRCVKQ